MPSSSDLCPVLQPATSATAIVSRTIRLIGGSPSSSCDGAAGAAGSSARHPDVRHLGRERLVDRRPADRGADLGEHRLRLTEPAAQGRTHLLRGERLALGAGVLEIAVQRAGDEPRHLRVLGVVAHLVEVLERRAVDVGDVEVGGQIAQLGVLDRHLRARADRGRPPAPLRPTVRLAEERPRRPQHAAREQHGQPHVDDVTDALVQLREVLELERQVDLDGDVVRRHDVRVVAIVRVGVERRLGLVRRADERHPAVALEVHLEPLRGVLRADGERALLVVEPVEAEADARRDAGPPREQRLGRGDLERRRLGLRPGTSPPPVRA